MTLNLFTPLFRSGMLQKIKASIPNEPDINWIIVISYEREILKHECETLNLKYVTVPEPDGKAAISSKVNKAIEVMLPGFLQGIDDDTTFHPNTYKVFKQFKDHKLIIGEQELKDGTKRPAQKPARCYTDGAQMLVHSDIVKQIKFGCFTTDPQADCQFMLDCWEKCKPEEILIYNSPISYYNWLR